jgi:hypothetical protein
LHGHSVKQGVFMCVFADWFFWANSYFPTKHCRYGVNDTKVDSSAGQLQEADVFDTGRIAPHKSMPTILSRILSTFRLENCMYRVNKQKEGTGRVVMHRRLKVPWVPFTVFLLAVNT